jgi:glycosyltransferase involved in cell wall biosynthesis
MRILILNNTELKGGAARVAWNLANGLRSRGHDVEYWVGNKSSEENFVSELPKTRSATKMGLPDKVIYRLGLAGLELTDRLPRAAFVNGLEKFDVIHLHDLGAFNWRHFGWLSRQAPLVWTIHSMGPFTGGCIYSYECDRYMNSCGSCPQVGRWPLHCLHRDGTRLTLRLKQWLLRGVSLRIVGVSDWIRERCSESSLLRGYPAITIRNAADPKSFFPSDRDLARKRLGVPLDARTVMISVGGDPQDDRKGLDLAVVALRALRGKDLFLLPLGIAGESPALHEALAEFRGLPARHVSDDATLRDYYSAADVVWHPSRADTSSMVSLEAFACGTPVIAAKVGGVPEIVASELGILIPPNDPAALADATCRLFEECGLHQRFRSSLSDYPRLDAYERFVSEYEELYRAAIISQGPLVSKQ